MHHADVSAVLRGVGIEVVGGVEPAGAGHALHQHAGVAVNVPGHEFRQRAGIFHIAAGDAGADDQADLLVFIEGRCALCVNR
jgi:hypothetical protein